MGLLPPRRRASTAPTYIHCGDQHPARQRRRHKRDRDRDDECHSFIAYYENEQRAGEGVEKVIARAAAEARRLRHGAHHRMTTAGVAAYYLSAPTASVPPGPGIKKRAAKELGPLLAAALGVFRIWRLGKAIAIRSLLLAVLAAAGSFLALGCAPAQAQPSPEPFEIVPGSLEVKPSRTDAGAHADLSISLELAHGEDGRTFGDLRTATVELPTGFVGSPEAVPACPQAEFLAGEMTPACSPASQIGTIGFEGQLQTIATSASMPLYNLVPTEPGVPAELGFRLAAFTQLLPVGIRSDDGGLTVSVRDVSSNLEPRALSIEIWGVPAAADHDPERGRFCLGVGGPPSCQGGEEAAGAPPRPFLANPTRCGPAVAEVRADSWEAPQVWSSADAEAGPIGDCGAVGFEPAIAASATSRAAESPSGFSASLEMPTHWSDPDGRASSALREARIALPEGFSLNPSFAAELEACVLTCPEASIVGTVEAETPILDEALRGNLYLTEPFEGPTGTRIAFKAVAEAPAAGIRVELPIRLDLDPRSGRPTAVIEDAPQLPIERLEVSLGASGSGPLVTPAACGDIGVGVELTPWSAPGDRRRLEDRVTVDRGVAGQPCPSIGSRPFHPQLSAASIEPRAGAYSAFRLHVAREDGEAPLGAISFRLPPGLSAGLAGVAVCPEAALVGARARSAATERADPSCPQGSLLGRTLIEAGVGGRPARIPGQAYLAGPAAGSSLSVALVTPALLGPFDLGTVVVREPLRLDPRSGALVVGSADARLPAVIDGIPLRVRGVAIDLDRPEFLRNPTSCRAQATRAVVEGIGPEGEIRSATLSRRYRVEACRRLRFAPTLQLRFLGTTARNGHPGLRVAFFSHPDEANLASASISMPPDLLIDPGRIGAPCGPRALASRTCPARSVVGRALAVSPLLGEPLHGQLYLRRNPQARLPGLVVDLQNRKVRLQIGAKLQMGPSGVSVVTEAAPDLPISKLVLVVAGGRRGLLVHSAGFCTGFRRLGVRMVGHNGKARSLRARLPAHCPPRHDTQGPRTAR
ncbi:MAG TPA: DUF2600 family protein [Solirubrobacterales bacterium]